MDRQTRRLFLATLGLLVLVGLAITLFGGGGAPGSSTPSGPPSVPAVEGVVVKVDSTGLGSVSAFTLRTDDGRSLVFRLASLQNGVQFPPGHLAEHQATSARVRVWYRESSGVLEALWLEDVPAG